MKVTKEELAEIIKEEVQNKLNEVLDDVFKALDAGEEEGDRIKLDAKGIPLEKPPLPKNWRKLPFTDLRRRQYSLWYTTYGPGSKRKKTAAKPISKGKKLPNVKAPAYDPKKDKFAGSYPELDTPSGIDPVQHAMDRAYDAEVKGQYRVARRFFRFACKNDYKSKTSGKNTACAKAKEMTAKMDKGMGIQKGSDFDKSRSEPNPKEQKEPAQGFSRRLQKGKLSKDFKTGKITYTDANGKTADVTSAKAKGQQPKVCQRR